MNNCQRTALGAAFLWVAAAAALHADVKLPAIFGDHMVLQEQAKLPVWGTADPGEKVTVKVGSESGDATADSSGHWRVELAPLPANAAPVTMTVTGKNTVTFSDVLVGEVWVCSGQSNMEFGIGNDSHGAETIAQANEPEIRLFMVPKATNLQPQTDIKVAPPVGVWQVCTPQTMAQKWGWNGFSAVGYYFGRNIHDAIHKPVGLIGTYWGGTPAQAWTSLSGLEKDAVLKHYVDFYQKNLADFPQATADYPAKMAAFKTQLADWYTNGGKDYETQLSAWTQAMKTATPGQPLPPKPTIATPKPRAPATPDGGQNAPTDLYNAMIAPLIPYAIKGAIWYQGEANAGASAEYGTLFPEMIKDWREKWGEGDFPFFFVQLAGWDSGSKIQSWPFLREAQDKALALPETGVATAVDIGDPHNIHPVDKLDIGNRLALAARHIVYGEKLVYYGPFYEGMKAKGNSIAISFTHEGDGLIIGQAPWTAPGMTPLPTDKLVGFEIAGADKKFFPADATIDGKDVTVSSTQVPTPVAVRYDWMNAPQGNLYNKENLPAFPFRTDDWVDWVAQGLPKTAAASAAK
jgi:sialate O-acetylesterase